MMNKPTVLQDGTWLWPISIWAQEPAKDLPAADRKHVPEAQNKWDAAAVGAHVYRSTDRGATLTKIATVRTSDPSPDEHMIVERRDRSLWMLIRDRGGMSESLSRDRGLTWTAPQPSRIPHAISRFFIRRLRSGNLLLVKHNPPTIDPAWMRGQPVAKAKIGRSHLAAFLSKDDGMTWTGGLMLDERTNVSYPDGDESADGRIFIVYDRNRKAEREVLVATFTEADVAAGRLVDQKSALRLVVTSVGGAK
jgi:hypothetical protein